MHPRSGLELLLMKLYGVSFHHIEHMALLCTHIDLGDGMTYRVCITASTPPFIRSSATSSCHVGVSGISRKFPWFRLDIFPVSQGESEMD
jgi:hypothetical protein